MAEMRESNSKTISKLTVDVDVSEALKGLKALKREANEAVKILNELGVFLNNNEIVANRLISVFTTAELREELEKRESFNKVEVSHE
jgi:hypothetical protein